MVMGFWNAGFGKTQNSHLIRHAMRKPCGSIFQNCPLLRSSWRANARCCWRVDSQALLSHFKTILKHLNTKIKENWKSSILLSVFRTAEKAIFTQKTAVIFWISKQFLAFQKFKCVHFEKYPKTVQIVHPDYSASTSRGDGNLMWYISGMASTNNETRVIQYLVSLVGGE